MGVKYLTKLIGHSDSDVLSVAFSDNAVLLASLHSDGLVDIWSTQVIRSIKTSWHALC